MSTVKLDLRNFSIPEKVQKARQIVAAMTGNANFPGLPAATLTAVTNAALALETGYNEALAARNAAIAKTEAQRRLEDGLDALLTQLSADVQSRSGGDAVKIQSAAMEVRGDAAPMGELAQVTNLAVTMGDAAGELDAHWNPVRGTRSYRVETTTDPAAQANWTIADVVTKSSATVQNLVSGSKVWLRVAAVGASGTGPWSDPATHVVP